MVPKRIYYLFEQYLAKTLKDVEGEELAKWIEQADDNELDELLQREWQSEAPGIQMPLEMSERLRSGIFPAQTFKYLGLHTKKTQKRIASRSALAAAAVFLVLISTFSYLWFRQPTKSLHALVEPSQKIDSDIFPGDNNAMLTLSDGCQILLNKTTTGTLAHDENNTIINFSNGKISYKTEALPSGAKRYNILTTPNGGQYQLDLPDGTRAWLNASSSIRFSTNYTSAERRIQMTGEVYFEVASLPRKKGKTKSLFIVEINKAGKKQAEVEVTGTQFNVNAYGDEAEIRTTLLEGSIKIKSQQQNRFLVPGQQAVIKDRNIQLKNDLDTEESIAWKNGYFQFENTELSDVLKQAARWYDLKIVYAGVIPQDRFTGKLERSVKLSRLLKWMQWSDIKFKLNGKTMIVSQ